MQQPVLIVAGAVRYVRVKRYVYSVQHLHLLDYWINNANVRTGGMIIFIMINVYNVYIIVLNVRIIRLNVQNVIKMKVEGMIRLNVRVSWGIMKIHHKINVLIVK